MKRLLRNSAWLGIPLVALGLLLPRAGDASDEGDVEAVLLTVNRLYEEFEYERALAQLQLARSMPRRPNEEAALSLYEGILLCEKGQFAKGETAFRTALLMQPGVNLPVRVAPKIDALFDSVRKEMTRKTMSPSAALADANAPRQSERVHSLPEEEALKVSSPVEVARPLGPGEADVPLVPALVAQQGGSDVAQVVAKSPDGSGLVPVDAVRPLTVSGQRTTSGALRKLSLIPAVAGVLLVAGGGFSLSASHKSLEQLRTGDSSIRSSVDVQNVVSSGKSMQTLGGSLLGVGSLALVSAAGMFLWGGPAPKSLSLGLSMDGTSAFVHGRWP